MNFLHSPIIVSMLFARFTKPLATCAILLGASCFVLPARAQIYADFNGGNGTSSFDQYVGTTGSGWSSAFSSHSNGVAATTFTNTVTNTMPLNGQGNYLLASSTNPSTSTAANAYTDRQFDGSGAASGSNTTGIDVTKPVQYSWLFSPTNLNATFLFVNQIGGTASGTGASDTWDINSQAGVNIWAVQNFPSPGPYSSGISVVAGHVYSFTLTSTPSTNSYICTITDLNTTATYTSPSAAFRDQTGSDGTSLGYGMFIQANAGGNATSGYSLDSIMIQQVPEPSARNLIGLAVVLSGGFLVGRRRLTSTWESVYSAMPRYMLNFRR